MLVGWKTKLGVILVFISGGLNALGQVELGSAVFGAGVALGFIGVRYAKRN